MIEKSAKLKVLEAILESPEFRDSKRYQDLLRFLVEQSLEGKPPKEVAIAMQLFGRDAKFDPREDPTVRVYMNNLRKKLDHYHLTHEPSPSIRLEIPKGHYLVEFLQVQDKKPAANKERTYRLVAGSVLIVAVLAAAYLLFLRNDNGKAPPATMTSPIWAEFVQPGGRPTLVVLGDFFFLYERRADGKRGNFVRNMSINTPDDYKEAVRRDPAFSGHYVQSDFTFLRPSATWGVVEILPILEHSPNGYSLKLSSQVTFDDLKSNNVVFIGSFKTLYGLQKILHLFDLEYELSPACLRVKSGPGDSTRTFMPGELRGGNYEKDFAVVAKAPGPNGSINLLLLGFADAGVLDAARTVADAQMLKRIETDYAKEDLRKLPSFTLVLESEGINQAVFKSDIRYFSQRHIASQAAEYNLSDSSHIR